MREVVPSELAKKLRERGFYVSRHANWLIVMKDGKMYALVYVYPLYEEVEVVEVEGSEGVLDALKEVAPGFSVRKRKARYQAS